MSKSLSFEFEIVLHGHPFTLTHIPTSTEIRPKTQIDPSIVDHRHSHLLPTAFPLPIIVGDLHIRRSFR